MMFLNFNGLGLSKGENIAQEVAYLSYFCLFSELKINESHE